MVTEEVQTTAAEVAGTMAEQRRTPEQTQTPEGAGAQEMSRRVSLEASSEAPRKVSLEVQTAEEASLEVGRRMSRKVSPEVRRFPTQEIPQDLP
jgi:hypothetical protein